MTLGQNIRRIRKANHMTLDAVASAIGTDTGNLSRLERDIQGYTKEGLNRLAELFGLQVADLFLDEVVEAIEQGRYRVREAQAKYNTDPGPVMRGRVPVLSWVQAGAWSGVVDNHTPGHAEEWADVTVPIHQHTYALRVKGDSMTNPTGQEPTFPPGVKIIVEPDLIDAPANMLNHFVIVRANGDEECTFKQLIRDSGRYYLKPLNPTYPMLPLPDDATFCGVVREKVVRFV